MSQVMTLAVQNTEAFSVLYEDTHLLIFRYIYGLHGGPQQAVEDLTAETYLRAWKSRHRFNGDEKAATGWLLKIARNLVIDTQRRWAVRRVFNTVVSVVTPSPETEVMNREQHQEVWQALQALPIQQREILILRYMLDWQVKAIAAYMELKENTVSVKIRRALQYLRDHWSEEDSHA